MYTTNIVLKIASRCNLNCTYCYMYNMGDNSYIKQPKIMSEETKNNFLNRLKIHCKKHKLSKFTLIFHGGEPMLAGKQFFRDFLKDTAAILPNIDVDFAMQTNGVLLSKDWCEFFKDSKIQIGISIDGTPKANDEFRIYHNGKGSYSDIVKGIENTREIYGNEKISFISVINTNESAKDVYNHLCSFKPYSISFLFPDINYKHSTLQNIPKVGDWLIEIFDEWYRDKTEEKPIIKPLAQLVLLILGNKYSGNELFGRLINDTIVIETDGSIETVDPMRICGESFTRNKLNVKYNGLDDIYNTEIAQIYYNGHKKVCKICEECPLLEICGGGYVVTRYSEKNEFDNPSIYCNEIVKLISHVQNRLILDLPSHIVSNSYIEKIEHLEILEIINKNKLKYEY